MCQQCPGEKQAILLTPEQKTTIQGFLAGRDGKICLANPYDKNRDRCLFECWEYGWLCWTCARPVIPISVLLFLCTSPVDKSRLQEIHDRFFATRELPSELLEMIEPYK
ncbi:MAG: hypothetical protein Q8L24_02250 [bacterium]|nr:hypothetical protein [bacterium]